MSAPNRYEVEARSYELDAYGHVNIAVYVNWFEHGRLGYLRDRGMTYTSIPQVHGVHVMVVNQNLDYRAQILLGDRLTVETALTRIGRTSLTFEQTLSFPDGRIAARAGVTMVAVGPDGRSHPVPDALRKALDPA